MATEFTPIFVFILLAIFGIAAGMVGLSAILSTNRRTAVKQMPYESGMDPIGDARQRFDVRYYLVAIAFLLFDVELLFLYPWAVGQWSADAPNLAVPAVEARADAAPVPGRPPVVAATAGGVPSVALLGVGIPPAMRNLVFGEILVFIAVLAAAFAYAWRKGVFEWR
jgi:NADH-quinone oxidoreductase subunit A